MAKVGSLNVDLTLETARFNRNLGEAQTTMNRAQQGFQRVGQAIGAALAGGAVLAGLSTLRDMTRAALDSVGGLGEQAAALGVTTDALQEYRYAATQVGLSAQEMDQALAQLTRRTGDAAAGSGEAAAAFTRLGINIRDAEGNVRNTADLIPEIADAMQRVPSEAERAAIAVDLFGRSGQKLATLLAGGSGEIRDMAAAARELGLVLSSDEIAKADEVADRLAALNYQIEAQQNAKLLENADALLAYEEAVGGLKLTLIEATGASIDFWNYLDEIDAQNWAWFEQFTQDMNAWGAASNFTYEDHKRAVGEMTRTAANAFGEYRASVNAMAQDVAAAFGNMVTASTQWVQQLYTDVRSWLQDRLGAVFDWVKGKLREVERAFHWLADETVFNSHIPDMVTQIGQWMGRLDGLMVDPALEATREAENAFASMAQNVLGTLQGLAGAIKSGGFFDILGAGIGVLQRVLPMVVPQGGGFTGGDAAWEAASRVPGFANGGALRLGGFPGIDQNVLSLNGSPIARVSRGEVARVIPANERGGGGTTIINNHYTLPSKEFWGQVDGRVAGAAPAIARAGSDLALASMAQRNSRRLA